MTQKSFTPPDSTHTDFYDPKNWVPSGVPQNGDQVGIAVAKADAGAVLPTGVTIGVFYHQGHGVFGSLLLHDATIPAATTVDEYTQNDTYSGSLPSSLRFAGTIENQGTLILRGGVQTISLPSGTAVTNDGTIDVFGSAPQFSAGGPNAGFVNNGLIRVVNPADQSGQVAYFGIGIGGAGTISVSQYSAVEFAGSVSSSQSLQFVGGANAAASVQIDQASVFAGTIGGFVSGDTLTLATTAATSATYIASGAGSGTLQIFNGGSLPAASLKFAGVYGASSFNFREVGSSLLITTNVTNAQTGSTVTPTSSGVFRFFDTSDGTHFFTASVAERDTVLVNRPDLIEESNGFGTVTTAGSTTESVYRFFDTVHGTHFFTASAAERDQTIATRSDLTYEPSATFAEDATQQVGDVAVYRLFSKTDGTHLYTGSASELTALTMPGTTGFRPDLVSEGIAFYAPGGSYT